MWALSHALLASYANSHSSPEPGAESLGESCSAGDAFAPSKSSHTPEGCSCKDKTTECSHHSRFGITWKPSTAGSGEAVLTWYRGVFLALTCPPPDAGPESTAPSLDSGVKWPESSAKYDPATRSWKTRQYSLLGGLEEYSETWPRWGICADGESWALSTPALRTDASGYGLWPTVRAADGDRGGRGDLIQAVRGNENSHYRLWQTPVADDAVDRAEGKRNSRGEPKLSGQVKLWPTPNAGAGDRGAQSAEKRKAGGHNVNLPDAVKDEPVKIWATPQSSDNRDRDNLGMPAIQRRIEKGKQVNLSMSVSHESGSLNPDWVELLMGWLLFWTRLDTEITSAEMDEWQRGFTGDPAPGSRYGADAWRSGEWESGVPRVAKGAARQSRLKAIGNGQVPACVALAWHIIGPGAAEQSE